VIEERKGKKASNSSPFEQGSLTWNVVAPAVTFQQDLFEQAEVSGRTDWNIRLKNYCR